MPEPTQRERILEPSHFAGAVGTRSRASRRRLSDHDIWWSASDRRWFPARPAARSQQAQSWKGPNTIGIPERAWQKRQKTRRNMQRRTRRSASTLGGAAPETIIGRAAADRAGARPYRATRCENASKWATRIAPAARFERNDVTFICETVTLARKSHAVKIELQS